jgi:hypothetical protein
MDLGKAHQLGQVGEAHQRLLQAGGRALGLERRIHRLHRLRGRQQRTDGEDRQLVADVQQRVGRQHRRVAAFDHVGQQRQVEAAADVAHLVLALRRLDEQDVGTGTGIGLGAAQRLVQAQRRARVGTRDDEKVG